MCRKSILENEFFDYAIRKAFFTRFLPEKSLPAHSWEPLFAPFFSAFSQLKYPRTLDFTGDMNSR